MLLRLFGNFYAYIFISLLHLFQFRMNSLLYFLNLLISHLISLQHSQFKVHVLFLALWISLQIIFQEVVNFELSGLSRDYLLVRGFGKLWNFVHILMKTLRCKMSFLNQFLNFIRVDEAQRVLHVFELVVEGILFFLGFFISPNYFLRDLSVPFIGLGQNLSICVGKFSLRRCKNIFLVHRMSWSSHVYFILIKFISYVICSKVIVAIKNNRLCYKN